jgi:hypothetical protein
LDVAGNVGGVLPAQKEGRGVKVGTFMGFDKGWAVNTLFVLLPSSNITSLYIPAFSPGIVSCPAAVEERVTGPIVVSPVVRFSI